MDLTNVDLTKESIRSQIVSTIIPQEKEKIIIKAPSYYMNNRRIFIQKLTELFRPYQDEILDKNEKISCDNRSRTSGFELLTHQKIVRDYLNLYTPYRGLLLYHGLGSGKTCTSIAIAEGMKSNKKIYVLTPASLKMNFYSEMKKCGDELYKKNQYWEFVGIEGQPDYVPILAKALSLSTNYIRENGGAWLVNINNKPNYKSLSVDEQNSLDNQLNEMIKMKYSHISYNAPNLEKIISTISDSHSKNPFDNSVVVIDEAHNFVSRIINQIKSKRTTATSYRLYNYIMNANNAKVILLSGTPVINYPNEIGILYNLIRGYIKTWTIPVQLTKGKINTEKVIDILDKEKLNTFDLVEYGDNKVTITRNPFGFINVKKRGVLKGTKRIKKGGAKNKTKKGLRIKFAEKLSFNEEELTKEETMDSQSGINLYDDRMYGGDNAFEKYNGVKLDESGNISDEDFLAKVIESLNKNDIKVNEKQITKTNHKALPDNANEFLTSFVDVDTGNSINMNLFKRRILGLTSYFRSAQEELLPRYEKTEEGDIYHIEKTEMTDYQFLLYEKIRKEESDKESRSRKAMQMKRPENNEMYTMSSSYRVFSRSACNFTFPEAIDRPLRKISKEELDERDLDMVEKVDEENQEEEEQVDNKEIEDYTKKLEMALKSLNVNKEGTNEKEYLSESALKKYSPKFERILHNLKDPNNKGLHLLYSHFRTLEGIGILRLILLANGFAEFKLKRVDGGWDILENPEDKGKPRFVLYTGTETPEEKEIIRNVFNSMWEYVPSNIVNKLQSENENNILGETIKVMMITASGAEGINLRNTRYVHIVEPYWHMVRIEQVVGRARRICSHEDLPEELRTVKVFLYVATLSEKQRTDDKHIELIIRDTSKVDKKTPLTTDETLYELASIKQRINNQILTSIKESAIDCNLYSKVKSKNDEQLVCYGFGKVESNRFSSYPVFEKDKQDKGNLDVKLITWKGVKITESGKDYVLNRDTNEVYDYNSYKSAISNQDATELILIGKLINEKGNLKLKKE